MARVELTVTEVNVDGVAEPAEQDGDPTNGNYIANNRGRLWIVVRNSGGTNRQLVIQTGATFEGQPVEDKTYTIAAGATRLIGPFSTTLFNQPPGANENELWLDPAHTDLKFRVYQLAGTTSV